MTHEGIRPVRRQGGVPHLVGPAMLCLEEGCPAPLTKAIGVSRIFWSDAEGWQGMNGTFFRFVGSDGYEDEVQNHASQVEWIEVLGVPQDDDDVWVPPGWTITIDHGPSQKSYCWLKTVI